MDNVLVAAGLGRLDIVRARAGDGRGVADPWRGDVADLPRPERHELVMSNQARPLTVPMRLQAAT